jgi:hypothetical protein
LRAFTICHPFLFLDNMEGENASPEKSVMVSSE